VNRIITNILDNYYAPEQHLYNGLARPANYSVDARKWTRLPAGESMLAQKWTCPHGLANGQ